MVLALYTGIAVEESAGSAFLLQAIIFAEKNTSINKQQN